MQYAHSGIPGGRGRRVSDPGTTPTPPVPDALGSPDPRSEPLWVSCVGVESRRCDDRRCPSFRLASIVSDRHVRGD